MAAFVSAVEAGIGKWLVDGNAIGLTEYRAAGHLLRAPDRKLRLTELAHRVGLNQSSVTRLVGRMESKGLVYRDTCPDDGRGVYAVITDRGVSVLRELREPYERRLRELVAEAAAQHPQIDASGLARALGITG